jgi:hypothetical protein
MRPASAERGEDLRRLGEAALGVLGEEEASAGEDVELPLAARRDRRGDPGFRLDLGCETRSPRVVAVSGWTVENLDLHAAQPSHRYSPTVASTVFAVEQAGCPSCAARVREALNGLAAVVELTIDEDDDVATVRLAPGAAASEDEVNRVLDEISQGTGHAYRVKPGSWHAG